MAWNEPVIQHAILWLGAAGLAVVLLHAFARPVRRRLAEPGADVPTLLFTQQQITGRILAITLAVPGAVTVVLGTWWELEASRAWTPCLLAFCLALAGALHVRMKLEVPLRRADWNRSRYLLINLFFLLDLFLPILIALLLLGLARLLRLDLPAWSGAAWIVVGIAVRQVLPLTRLLGPEDDPPTDLDRLYREHAGLQATAPLRVVRTGGAQFPNALAAWRPGRRWVLVTEDLLDVLSRREALSILLHEAGHHAYAHVPLYVASMLAWQVLATVVLAIFASATFTYGLFAYLGYRVLILPRISQRCEHACDRFAADRCDSKDIYARALRKLHAAAFLPAHWDDRHNAYTHPSLARRLQDLGVELDPREQEAVAATAAHHYPRSGLWWATGGALLLTAAAPISIASGYLLWSRPVLPQQAAMLGLFLLVGLAGCYFGFLYLYRHALARGGREPPRRPPALFTALLWTVATTTAAYHLLPGPAPPGACIAFATIFYVVASSVLARQRQRDSAADEDTADTATSDPVDLHAKL